MRRPVDGGGAGSRIATAAFAAFLSGCSGGGDAMVPAADAGTASASMATFASVTSYGAANAFVTTGYSDREIGPDHFVVRAKGTSITPAARLEKIALARAAELGVENGKPFFKAGPPSQSVACKAGKDAIHKSGKVPPERNVIVEIDVVYAKRQPDASYQSASDVQARLLAELAAEVVSTDAKDAAASALAAQCGK